MEGDAKGNSNVLILLGGFLLRPPTCWGVGLLNRSIWVLGAAMSLSNLGFSAIERRKEGGWTNY